MTGYYRTFIKDYAGIAKPSTKHLSTENGKVSQYKPKNTEIKLDQEGIQACEKFKIFLPNKVELYQPDYNKKNYFNYRCIKYGDRGCIISG